MLCKTNPSGKLQFLQMHSNLLYLLGQLVSCAQTCIWLYLSKWQKIIGRDKQQQQIELVGMGDSINWHTLREIQQQIILHPSFQNFYFQVLIRIKYWHSLSLICLSGHICKYFPSSMPENGVSRSQDIYIIIVIVYSYI